MKMITAQDFHRLAEVADTVCVSLLMPTHRTGRETNQDPIRFKNLLGDAEAALIAGGRQPADVRQQLEPLRQLIDDPSFWAHQDQGLATFCLPEETHVYGVPFSLSTQVMVGPHAYLVPLIPIVSEDVRFYVLALSPKRVRLLEGTRHTARVLDLPGWPENFRQLASYIEKEPQLQFHTETAPHGSGRARPAMFHGHPGADESTERKQRLLEYCRLIDQRLQKVVRGDRVPLVLACDERLAAIYRKASHYPRVVGNPLAGNPDTRKSAELCHEAGRLLEPLVFKAREQARTRYHEAAAHGQAAERLDAVLPAAHQGRVDTLLVAAEVELWGQYDPNHRRLDLHDRPGPHDEELVNLATVVAYRQGAVVYALPQEHMPDNQSAVAVLWY
jgi:hypothetical protein